MNYYKKEIQSFNFWLKLGHHTLSSSLKKQEADEDTCSKSLLPQQGYEPGDFASQRCRRRRRQKRYEDEVGSFYRLIYFHPVPSVLFCGGWSVPSRVDSEWHAGWVVVEKGKQSAPTTKLVCHGTGLLPFNMCLLARTFLLLILFLKDESRRLCSWAIPTRKRCKLRRHAKVYPPELAFSGAAWWLHFQLYKSVVKGRDAFVALPRGNDVILRFLKLHVVTTWSCAVLDVIGQLSDVFADYCWQVYVNNDLRRCLSWTQSIMLQSFHINSLFCKGT